MKAVLHVHSKEPHGKDAEQLADRLRHGWEEDFSTQVVIDNDNYTVVAEKIK